MSQDFQTAFAEGTRGLLSAFVNTAGQCVAVCATLSLYLTDHGIAHQVALGSIYCRGVPAFKYTGLDIPENPTIDIITLWDGHAWIEFPEGFIGEPSLLRTAQAAPKQSNLRMTLDALGILNSGALLMTERQFLISNLRYERICYLPVNLREPLAGGLIALNRPMPDRYRPG